MEKYKIEFYRDAYKELKSVPKDDLTRILKRIEGLSTIPYPVDSKKLKGEDHLKAYRIRQGDYRVVYLVNDERRLVTIAKIGHRREVYR